MPTITVTLDTLAAFGVSRTDLTPALTLDAKSALQPLLASRDFDMRAPVQVVELATGEGFVFSQ
jgi:hypothetical protein